MALVKDGEVHFSLGRDFILGKTVKKLNDSL